MAVGQKRKAKLLFYLKRILVATGIEKAAAKIIIMYKHYGDYILEKRFPFGSMRATGGMKWQLN